MDDRGSRASCRPMLASWFAKHRHEHMSLAAYFAESARILELAREAWSESLLAEALGACITALRNHRPVLVCGNGGSAADAMHLTAELVGRFLLRRQAFNVICLSSNPALLTAWANDYTYKHGFLASGGSLRRAGRGPHRHQHVRKLPKCSHSF